LAARELDVRAWAVSDELIRVLAERPELMYELRPRQFEELLADIFARQGFDVELTQQTRDGGYDLWVVHHMPAGRLLTRGREAESPRPACRGRRRPPALWRRRGDEDERRTARDDVVLQPGRQAVPREDSLPPHAQDYFDLQTMLDAAAARLAGRSERPTRTSD
jgi:hypothetical protein